MYIGPALLHVHSYTILLSLDSYIQQLDRNLLQFFKHTRPNCIFKPGACWLGQRAPGFVKLFWCGRLYVCMHVCPPPRLLITSGIGVGTNLKVGGLIKP